MFYSGVRPAINAGLSVSRVGGSAQIKPMKKVSGTLRIDLASYRELEAFSQFGSDLDQQTQQKLNRGRRTVEVLKQPLHKPVHVAHQVIIFFALTHGFLDSVPVDKIKDYERELYQHMTDQYDVFLKEIVVKQVTPDEEYLIKILTDFSQQFNPSSSRGSNAK